MRGIPKMYNHQDDYANMCGLGGVYKADAIYRLNKLLYANNTTELTRLGIYTRKAFYDRCGTSINLAFEGDSLTDPIYSGYAMHVWAGLLNSNNIVHGLSNGAIGGENVDQIMQAAETAEIDGFVSSSVTHNIAVLWIGTNNLPGTDIPTETQHLYDCIHTWCDDRHTAGYSKIIVNTLTPSANILQGANHENARLAFNAMLLADYHFCDAVADIGADSIMGDYAQATSAPNAYYDATKVHHTAAGQVIDASYVTAAILEVL